MLHNLYFLRNSTSFVGVASLSIGEILCQTGVDYPPPYSVQRDADNDIIADMNSI